MSTHTQSDIGNRRRDFLVTLVVSTYLRASDALRLWVARARRRGRGDNWKVSVPLATYDRIELVVARTIPALLGQTHRDMELVIVGDGTPLGLWSRISEEADERIRWKRLAKRTRYPAFPLERWMVAGWRPRRVAARLSRGGWLLWMSDDDIIMPDGVEKLLNVVRQDPLIEVVTGSYYVGLDKKKIRRPGDGESGLGFMASGMPALLVRADLRGISWNRHSWRKKWNRPSDYDLMARLHRAGARWGSTNEVVAVVPEVEGTGQIGSRGAIMEDSRRLQSLDNSSSTCD